MGLLAWINEKRTPAAVRQELASAKHHLRQTELDLLFLKRVMKDKGLDPDQVWRSQPFTRWPWSIDGYVKDAVFGIEDNGSVSWITIIDVWDESTTWELVGVDGGPAESDDYLGWEKVSG